MKIDFGVIHSFSLPWARKINFLLALLFVAFLFWGNVSFAQTAPTYRIDKAGSYTSSQIATALKGVKLDQYRKLNSEAKLYFDEGTVLALTPGQTLLNNGQTVNQAVLLPENTPDRPDRKFSISASGWLMEAVPNRPHTK